VRRRLLARLGPEAGDAVDEFLKRALQQDRSMAPSLHSFLTLFEATDLNIKRDMEAAGEAVRVMTVHAAKGLEAKIVLLPDTCGAPGGRFDPKLFILDPPQTGPLIAWSPRGRDDCAALATARQTSRDAADDEYRRLLYVALTRAQERLYIMGYHGVTARPETCWFEMVARALGEGMVQVPAPWSSEETVRRLTTGAFTEPGLEGATAEQTERRSLPGWLETEAPGETAARALRPSRLDLGSAATADAAARKAARERGTLVHALLQNLAGIDPSLRRTASQRLMAGRKAAADPREADAIFAEVEAVLDDPRLAPLFAAGSRAEVAIAGAAGEHDFEISGQVDRIAVRPDEVLIADFKTGAAPAGRPPRAYVTQLALYGRALANLYPGRRIRALLVYTSGPSVSELSPEQQAEALAELARRRAT
jgi:ATP-dependent helicase/nuclease subunit A